MANLLSALLPSLAVAATITVWAIASGNQACTPRKHPLPLASVRYAMATCFAAIWLLLKRPADDPYRDLMTLRAWACGRAGYRCF